MPRGSTIDLLLQTKLVVVLSSSAPANRQPAPSTARLCVCLIRRWSQRQAPQDTKCTRATAPAKRAAPPWLDQNSLVHALWIEAALLTGDLRRNFTTSSRIRWAIS